MRIKIDDQYRDACILPAPKGSFLLNDGFPHFPNLVALTEPIGDESAFGDIVVCPITDYNGGYAAVRITELYNDIDPYTLMKAIKDVKREVDDNMTETEIINDLIESFEAHGTPILKATRMWVENRLKELSNG